MVDMRVIIWRTINLDSYNISLKILRIINNKIKTSNFRLLKLRHTLMFFESVKFSFHQKFIQKLKLYFIKSTKGEY